MPAPPIDDALVVLRREVIDDGLTDRWLRDEVRAGRLIRLRQGVYANTAAYAGAYPDIRHRMLARAIVRLYGDDVALSHVSACLEWGAPSYGLPLELVHLTDLHGAGERTKARIRHHRGTYLVDDLSRLRGGWLSSPARAVVETLPLVDMRSGVCLLDWVRQQGLSDLEQLGRMVDRLQHWPHSSTPRTWLERSDGLAESVGETLLRLLLEAWGIPAPVAQLMVRDHRGRELGRVDFAWPEHGVILEFDGEVKYRRLRRVGESIEDAVLREKNRENEIREATGWIVIRISWSDLANPADLVPRIRRALAWRAA